MVSTCPGLDLSHGFIHHIRKHQFTRLHQDQTVKPSRKPTIGRKTGSKPTLEPYKPPGIRLKEVQSANGEHFPELKESTSKIDEFHNLDLDGFIAEAQQFIQRAIQVNAQLLAAYSENLEETTLAFEQKPCSVGRPMLCEIAAVIVTRAWEDKDYFSVAAKLCAHIAKKEHAVQDTFEVPDYAFSRSVIQNCQQLLKDYESMRSFNMTMWLSFVRFVTAVYIEMRYNNDPIKSLCDILFSLLKVLAQPPCCWNFDEAEVLSSSLHDVGLALAEQDGEEMVNLIGLIRDCILHSETQTHTRRMLLEIIELSASNWQLSPGATNYYYGGF